MGARKFLVSSVVVAAAVGCGGGGDGVVVGGTITGLSGTGLVLTLNGGDDLTVTENGHFEFDKKVSKGKGYTIAVKTAPTGPSQTCDITRGNGTAGSKDVTDVAIACATNKFTVGGTVAGLKGTNLVLQNGTDTQTVLADGTFVFAKPVESGTTYNVMVQGQPVTPSQTCTIDNGMATMGDANVTNITVSCATNTFKIGGMVAGADGPGLVLQNNNADDLPITMNGMFQFAAGVESGANYDVTIKTQPTGKICKVTSGSGTVLASDITDVLVTCSTGTWMTTLFPITIPNDTFGLGDLAFDNNNDLLATVASPQKGVVRISRTDGSVTTIAMGITGNYVLGIAYRAANNMIYVNNDQGTIFSVDPTNGTVTQLATGIASLNAITIAPAGFGNFGGFIIGVTNGGIVDAIDPTNGAVTQITASAGAGSDLAFGPDGTLYIAGTSTVRTVTSTGTVATYATGFSAAEGITVAADNSRLFVADSGTDMVYAATIPGGTVSAIGAYDIDNGFFVGGILADLGNTVIVMTGENAMTLRAFSF